MVNKLINLFAQRLPQHLILYLRNQIVNRRHLVTPLHIRYQIPR